MEEGEVDVAVEMGWKPWFEGEGFCCERGRLAKGDLLGDFGTGTVGERYQLFVFGRGRRRSRESRRGWKGRQGGW